MNLVILKSYVVLINCVPFLNPDRKVDKILDFNIVIEISNLNLIFSGRVPTCAAINFFRSPIVSSSLHFTRTFFPRRSLQMTSIINSSQLSRSLYYKTIVSTPFNNRWILLKIKNHVLIHMYSTYVL